MNSVEESKEVSATPKFSLDELDMVVDDIPQPLTANIPEPINESKF